MTTPTVTELTRNGNPVGRLTELARYTVPAGQRILCGQRINGVVRVTDLPISGHGRAYVVERGLEEEGPGANAALQALIADYLNQAAELAEIPMATSILGATLTAPRP